MVRLSLILLMTLIGQVTYACSCINNYRSLDDLLCRADTTGGVVVEVVMTARAGMAADAEFTIARVFRGDAPVRSITIGPSNNSCTGYLEADDRVGDRFLLFTHPESLSDSRVSLFGCGFYGNLYDLDDRGTQILFPGQAGSEATAPRWEPLGDRLESPYCGSGPRPPAINPLSELTLSANPGNGVLRLAALDGAFPDVEQIDVYDSVGQLITSVRTGPKEDTPGAPAPIDLRRARAGVYTVVVRQGRYRKGLHYVKVG